MPKKQYAKDAMISSQPNPNAGASHLKQCVIGWARLWQTPRLQDRITIEFSQRLSRTLGLARPASGLIRLNSVLLQEANRLLLNEILCHEAAHIAVYECHGPRGRPHGTEWRLLMTLAGFRPRARIPADEIAGRPGWHKGVSYRYEHCCPVCQTVYIARRTDCRWRCAACVQKGREGKLLVVRRHATP